LSDGCVAGKGDPNGKLLRCHIHDDYPDVPNAKRIGWFLIQVWNLELDLSKKDYKSAIDMLLRMIEGYSNIVLVSIESNIVVHSTQEGAREKALQGERSMQLVFEEAAKLPQHLSKTRMAELIAPKVNLSVAHIRNKILPHYKKK
jgi:hypothetical protein